MSRRIRELVRADFHDAEQLADVARAWDLDFRQLTPGAFTGELWQATDGPTQVSRCGLTAHVHQQGSAPRGVRTLAILAGSDVRIRWRGQMVTGDQLMCFPQDGELESVSPPGFDVFTMTFPEELLEGIARDLDLSGGSLAGEGGYVMSPDPAALQSLRRRLLRLHEVQETLAADGRAPGVAWFRAVLDEEVPRALIRALAMPAADRRVSAPAVRSRDIALQRALQFIESRRGEALTVTQLCHEACVSERTLQYAFLERFGVRPKAFLRARRLHGARQELNRAALHQVTVTDVANRWGFWHLGQFAQDYFRMFGERPSETLAREASG